MRLLVLSDVHYASAGEQARRGHEARAISNPVLRTLARSYRHFIWLRDPYAWNHLLEGVFERCPRPDLTIANGDYNADTAFIGVSDDASMASAQECLGKLRTAYPNRLHATIGDHELGKMSLFGGVGGPRWRSFERTTQDLGLEAFWTLDTGDFVLMGVASTLLALPLFTPEILPAESTAWERARSEHLNRLRAAFDALPQNRRVILFCHDPSALPFLQREAEVAQRMPQIEATIIGHLHTRLIFGASRLLAGMPVLRGMGVTAKRLSAALREARCWRDFRVQLCPSLAGSELLKDGGFLTAELSKGSSPVKFQFHSLPRTKL